MVNKDKSSSPMEVPDCYYPREPTLVKPKFPSRRHTLHLSNLDDQRFLRFSIKYLYLYRKPSSVSAEVLRASLSRALVDYYPLAGRLREVAGERLEVDCNGEGAVFAEALVDMSAEEFLEGANKPNRSWRKLLYRVEAQGFANVPPLVVQVTHLSCGGMILCMAINHCVCDGIGTYQFLQAWAHYAAKPDATVPPTAPFHGRHMLQPLSPPAPITTASRHPEFHHPAAVNLTQSLLQQPLVPVSVTFSPSQIRLLKQRCVPSLKCTSFEALAAHVWQNWVRALDPPPALPVKLLFSVNVRKRMDPHLPSGFYGNGFVLGCAEDTAGELTRSRNLWRGVKLVQEAKGMVDDGYVREVVEHLEERRGTGPDLSASLVISQWSRLGLEDVDFGAGRPAHMGPVASEIYCLFLPLVGDIDAFTVLVSMPEKVAGRFEGGLRDIIGCNDGKEEEEVVEAKVAVVVKEA